MTDSPNFPLVDQIRAAGTPAAIAALLLRVPDAIIASPHVFDIADACGAAGFGDGVDFLNARLAALHAVRDAHGLMPDRIAGELEHWRQAMSRVSAGG